MVADDQEPNVPAIRQPHQLATQASSRLLKRGLMALDEGRTVCLEVVDLIVFESSVFVFWGDWDESTRPLGNTSPRRVVLFEFLRSGQFIRGIDLPLCSFLDRVSADIQEVRVLSESIYVREKVQSFYGDDVGPTYGTTLHYLFDRIDARRMVWCTEEWHSRPLESFEEHLVFVDFNPDFVTDKYFICLCPRKEDEHFFVPPLSPSLVESLRKADVKDYRVAHATGDDLRTLLTCNGTPTEGVAVASDKRADSLILSRDIRIPIDIAIGQGPVYGFEAHEPWYWSSWHKEGLSYTAENGVWFLYSSDGSYTNFDVVWSLKIDGVGPKATVYSLPNPWALVTQGVLDTYGLEGEVKLPHKTGDRFVLNGTIEYVKAIYVEGHFWYDRIFASGDYVVVSVHYDAPEGVPDDVLLLLEPKDSSLLLCRVIDLSLLFARTLAKDYDVVSVPTDRVTLNPEDEAMHSEVFRESRRIEHLAFRDGFFYSLVRSDDRQDRILITNVHTQQVTWFQPEVPENEMTSNAAKS